MIKFDKVHNNVRLLYHLISYWFVNIDNGTVLLYGVWLPCGPINKGTFFLSVTSLKMVLFQSTRHTHLSID